MLGRNYDVKMRKQRTIYALLDPNYFVNYCTYQPETGVYSFITVEWFTVHTFNEFKSCDIRLLS